MPAMQAESHTRPTRGKQGASGRYLSPGPKLRQPAHLSTVSHRVFIALRDRADHEGRSTSNLAAFLLEQALPKAIKKPAQGRQEGWHR